MFVDQLIDDHDDQAEEEEEEEKKAAADAREVLDADGDFSETDSAASNKTNPGGAGNAKVSGQAVDPSVLQAA